MSTYQRMSRIKHHVIWQKCTWIDDHYGHHLYGVKFPTGEIYDPRKTDIETRDWTDEELSDLNKNSRTTQELDKRERLQKKC